MNADPPLPLVRPLSLVRASLRRALLGQPFDPCEASTEVFEVDVVEAGPGWRVREVSKQPGTYLSAAVT